MFRKNTLYNGAPLSSTGSTRAVFPGVISTTKALRLPAPNTRSLIYSLPRPNSSPPGLVPCSGERPQGVALFILPHALGHRRVGRTQDLAGSQGIRSIPLPCSPTPAGPADLTMTANQCCPHHSENEDTNVYVDLEAQSHGFSIRCLRFK